MKSVFALTTLLAVAAALPQDIPVVRPNHYLAQGTFQDPSAGKAQHLLPESFYIDGQQVQVDLSPKNEAATPAVAESSPQQQTFFPGNLQAPAPPPAQQQRQQQAVAQGNANANQAPAGPNPADSYSNIGGASGRVASALTNSNEYGEALPQAFSNLQPDSYAYYQGHKTN